MARPDILLLLIATVSVVALAVNSQDAPAPSTKECDYTIKMQTGTKDNAGTDSVIGVTLADKFGNYIKIENIAKWGGKSGESQKYFQKGNLDSFSGKERCLPNPICFMSLQCDYSGTNPGWYVSYVDVTMNNHGSPSQHIFDVRQWLAVDEPPYELYTERNHCPESVGFDIRKSLYSIV